MLKKVASQPFFYYPIKERGGIMIRKTKKILNIMAGLWAVLALSKISGVLEKTAYEKEFNYLFIGLLIVIGLVYLSLGTYGTVREIRAMESKKEFHYFIVKNVFFSFVILVIYIMSQFYRYKGLNFNREDLFLLPIVYGMIINESYKRL